MYLYDLLEYLLSSHFKISLSHLYYMSTLFEQFEYCFALWYMIVVVHIYISISTIRIQYTSSLMPRLMSLYACEILYCGIFELFFFLMCMY